MSTHHVVMPFSRPQHADLYARHLKDAEVVWHPIVEKGGTDGLPRDTRHIELHEYKIPEADWIKPLVVGRIGRDENACYTKLNRFIAQLPVQMAAVDQQDYYTFMTDDNWWHIEYWKQLQWHMAAHKKPIILANQLRCGNAIKAAAENMRCCLFDISTLTVRGDVLREMRFEEHLWFADGLMAEQLRQRYGPDGIGVADGAWMYYNMLSPKDWLYPENTVTA